MKKNIFNLSDTNFFISSSSHLFYFISFVFLVEARLLEFWLLNSTILEWWLRQFHSSSYISLCNWYKGKKYRVLTTIKICSSSSLCSYIENSLPHLAFGFVSCLVSTLSKVIFFSRIYTTEGQIYLKEIALYKILNFQVLINCF